MSKRLPHGSEEGHFKPGQDLLCTVLAKEPGGYAVRLEANDQSGFIPTGTRLTIGEMLTAKYVCLDKGRHLLSILHAMVLDSSNQIQFEGSEDDDSHNT